MDKELIHREICEIQKILLRIFSLMNQEPNEVEPWKTTATFVMEEEAKQKEGAFQKLARKEVEERGRLNERLTEAILEVNKKQHENS